MRIKKILNKKGVGVDEWIKQIPYIVLTIVVMGVIFFIVNSFINTSIDVKPLEANVLFYRILYSNNSITYADEFTGRVYPGIIDPDRFSDIVLDKLINYSYERHISAKLELYDAGGDLLKTAYYNQAWYDRLAPLAQNRIIGSSGARLFKKSIPVLYRQNNVNSQGSLYAEIVTPR